MTASVLAVGSHVASATHERGVADAVEEPTAVVDKQETLVLACPVPV